MILITSKPGPLDGAELRALELLAVVAFAFSTIGLATPFRALQGISVLKASP